MEPDGHFVLAGTSRRPHHRRRQARCRAICANLPRPQRRSILADDEDQRGRPVSTEWVAGKARPSATLPAISSPRAGSTPSMSREVALAGPGEDPQPLVPPRAAGGGAGASPSPTSSSSSGDRTSGRPRTRVLCIDKRTGRIVYHNDDLQSDLRLGHRRRPGEKNRGTAAADRNREAHLHRQADPRQAFRPDRPGSDWPTRSKMRQRPLEGVGQVLAEPRAMRRVQGPRVRDRSALYARTRPVRREIGRCCWPRLAAGLALAAPAAAAAEAPVGRRSGGDARDWIGWRHSSRGWAIGRRRRAATPRP